MYKTTTKFIIERGDDELEVDVTAHYYLGSKPYFNYRLGEGHPGDPEDVDIVSVKYQGKDIELTESETEALISFICEEESGSDLDPDEYDDFDWRDG